MNVDSQEELIPIRKVCKLIGLKANTIRSWADTGKIRSIRTPSGQRLFPKSQLQSIMDDVSSDKEKENFLYCRVSSKKQLDDMERQKELLQSLYPNYKLITDCGSGINWKRKGLRTLLEFAMQGTIGKVVVAHKDRLCRFGFDLVKFIIETNGGEIVILDKTENQSSEQELAEDLLSIIHVYSCKQMGKRRYKKQNNTTQSNTETTEDTS